MAKKYTLFIALILVVSYFSLTSGSFLFVLLSCSPSFKSAQIREYEILLFDLRLPRVVAKHYYWTRSWHCRLLSRPSRETGTCDPVLGDQRRGGSWHWRCTLIPRPEGSDIHSCSDGNAALWIDRRAHRGDPWFTCCMAQRPLDSGRIIFGRGCDPD